MDKLTHEIRLEQWKKIIYQCQNRPKGQPAYQWLKDNGINSKSYYYWLRKIRRNTLQEVKDTSLPSIKHNEDLSNVSFAEIPFEYNENAKGVPDTFQPVAVIKTMKATVAVSDAISEHLLTRIIQEVSHAQ